MMEETNSTVDDCIMAGRYFANPLPGEEVVISGMSGAYPDSNNIHEYRDNLYNKVNMVAPNRRWDFKHPEIPSCSGTIPVINQYDAGYFGIHDRQMQTLDAMNRMFQEKAIEAILDAGFQPSDFENTKTGVFIGSSFSESEKAFFFDNLRPKHYAFTGVQRSMLAHRLSYFLKLKGPSFISDTACSSSMYAFENAYKSIRLGEVDAAIVGGTHLCLHPCVSLQFSRLGVLSMDGSCKVFDKSGNGYARSETIGVLILQKAKNAKRIYAQVMHAKTNCDGYKEQGITYPSGEAQRNLMDEFYQECDVDRYSLSFLEAHGTGTYVGDPEECMAIDDILAKGRKEPLLIGSVKSNVGHSEPGSGLCSITKCLIGMENGLIPPNIHYTTPRDEIKALHEGRMVVVTEKLPFQDNRGLIGINSFGFGGGNGHMVLHWNPKEKVNGGLPKDNLPRLVCVSGRTEEAISTLLNSVSEEKLDAEHVKLLHDVFRKNIVNHLYRGYSITSKFGEITRSFKYSPGICKPLYLAFGELSNWYDLGNSLMVLPEFNNSIQRIHKKLLEKGVNIFDLILNKSADRNMNYVLGSIAVQIGIIDIFSLMEIRPRTSVGCSFGELLSAYYNGNLNLEETINCAVAINESVNYVNNWYKSNNGNNQVNGHHISSHNLNDGISNGQSFNDNVMNGCDAALESLKLALQSNLPVIKERLMKKLSTVLKKRKILNTKIQRIKYSSAEHFINALISKDFQNSEYVGINSLILKIGSGLIPEEMEDVEVISLTNCSSKNDLIEFLKTIGSIYEYGYNPQIEKLYPPVALPVSRGTRMISPYIKWKHTKDWPVPDYNEEAKTQAKHGARIVKVQLVDHEWSYADGHIIDGRNLFPATGYLFLVWETLSIINSVPMNKMSVGFENCKFMRATAIPQRDYLQLNITIQKGSGEFEVVEGESPVVSGRIYLLDDNDYKEVNPYQPRGIPSYEALPLKTRDVYKELRLRGYNYKGKFRAIQECDNSASQGYIKWEDNWVSFIDNMLQLKMLQTDTRVLYVPTYISKLVIPAESHLKWIDNEFINAGRAPNLPVFNDQATGIIRCGNIRLHGLIASSIARKKYLGTPVLESYRFVPNVANLTIEQSVRVNMQIILENILQYRITAVELIDEFSKDHAIPLTPIILMALEEQPLTQPFLKILSKNSLDVPVAVEDRKLSSETDCLLIIVSNISKRPEIFEEAFGSLKENGYIMSREPQDVVVSSVAHPDCIVVTVYKTPDETLVLLQKAPKSKKFTIIEISSSSEFSWVTQVQEAMKTNSDQDIVLYSENEPDCGILGLVNSIRKEPGSTNVKCVFIMDRAKRFCPDDYLYDKQLKKHMAFNVYKGGQWGTYRHLSLDEVSEVESEHCYVNVTVRGDLSSLKWIEGPLRHNMEVPAEKVLVYVYYAALNFRDVMTASGRINADVITSKRIEQECVQGFEFSGRDERGNRVMGMVTHGALSTLVLADAYLNFKVPDSWSLEDAATIPVVYGTVIYALNVRINLKRGETILIHSGTGGIGQAAIRLALHYGCRVYTTVGTQTKREFLKKTFPQLKDRNIGNSHDIAFEQMIYRETNGRGVDVVLNSLAEDKLLASVRCLARGGRFLEIGKVDMVNNSHLSLLLFQKEASFHGVMLDQLFTEKPAVKREVTKILLQGLEIGAIKPLSKNVFKFNEVEQAFRFMATGKHMGKVLIQLRKPEREIATLPSIQKFMGIPRYFCNPDKTYIIAGGLGGFGLELTDWLVLRGARKLILTSRKGISTGYQNARIRCWRSYGAIIRVSHANVTSRAGCKELIEESQKLGPVDTIFNLAVVLADSIFENQSPENFCTSFGPKAWATQYLDDITRKMCPDLSNFVIFSSMSCGRGNAGQSNYAMSNSVMERICEKRKRDGYPALAIQWGAIGEVGLVADMQEEDTEIVICGTLQQKISSCLKVLDVFLRQNDPVVSSMVVAEKRGGADAADNIVDAVINILGLDNAKCVSFQLTLPELGMDSMTAVEIKQTLEREFEVFLSAKDMRVLTLARLKEIQEEISAASGNIADRNVAHFGIEMVFRLVGTAAESCLPQQRLKSKVDEHAVAPKVLLFPGIEGFSKVFHPLAARLNAHTICILYRYDTQAKTIDDMVKSIMPHVDEHLTKDEPFNILAYSYGAIIALEVIHILESRGYNGTVIFLDGAPSLMKEITNSLNIESEQIFQTSLVCHLLSFFVSFEIISKHKENIFKCRDWEERTIVGTEIVKNRSTHDASFLKMLGYGIYSRLKAGHSYSPSVMKLKSTAKLYKPKHLSVQGLPEDYNLSLFFEKPIEIQQFEGNHVTLIENELLAETINSVMFHNQ